MLLSFDHKYKKTSQVIQNEFWLSIVIEFNDFLVQLNRFKLFLENNNFYVLSLVCFKIYLLNKKFRVVKENLENTCHSKEYHVWRFFISVMGHEGRMKDEKCCVLLHLLFMKQFSPVL